MFPPKKASLYTTFDLQDLIACKFSHRWTCLYINICMSASFLCSISTIMFSHKRVVYETCSCARRVHARVYRIKDGYLHIFWLTKTCLRVKFNISHRVLHLTSHWYTWNDLKPHDFNLRTILRMQLLKYETTSENINLTDAKTMMRVHCKKTSLYATFRLTWAIMCVI